MDNRVQNIETVKKNILCIRLLDQTHKKVLGFFFQINFRLLRIHPKLFSTN